MSDLRAAVKEYLTLRRELGYRLRLPEAQLNEFVSSLEEDGVDVITTDQAVRWATRNPDVQPGQWAARLCAVRQFAKYRSGSDPRTEVPPVGLLPHRYARTAPYIYSLEEIRELLQAARELAPRDGLRGWTYATLFGLLAVTGLRISEGIALDCEDVDLTEGVLCIRRTKFGKSRLVPVHASVRDVLRDYQSRRNRFLRPRPIASSFFATDEGARLTDFTVRRTFRLLSHRVGLRGPSDNRGPRLHDFRHGFAVNTLIGWYRDGLNVDREMSKLSTYLGHGHVADTYWYLSSVPELLHLASGRLEEALGGLS